MVPVYSSSFLTSALNQMPSVILPPLDDIISVGHAEPLKQLKTWAGSSKDVFDAMAKEIGTEHVILGANIKRVVRCVDRVDGAAWRVDYVANSSSAGSVVSLFFDDVVFACPATAVDALTRDSVNYNANNNSTPPLRGALFDAIIPNVRYENERDDNFVEGIVHSDRCAAIPNAAMRDDLLAKGFTNYIELIGNPADGKLENSFILGTWVPEALFAASRATVKASEPVVAVQSKKKFGRSAKTHSSTSSQSESKVANTQMTNGVIDMFVTYQPAANRREAVRHAALATVDNSWAHPQFTMQSMGLSMALPLLQGRSGVYYCASYTTPGNGHDLSLLSGLAVAYQLSGGYYPFSETASPAARRDFELLKGLLFW